MKPFRMITLLAAAILISGCRSYQVNSNPDDISGLWNQYMPVENSEVLFGGLYGVKKTGSSYEMFFIDNDTVETEVTTSDGNIYTITKSGGISNVILDGNQWSFDSDWGDRTGHFILNKVSDDMYEGYSYLNNEKRSFNRWERLKGYVKRKKGLFIRTNPGRAFEKVAVVPYGGEVIIYQFSDTAEVINGIEAKWARVRYRNFTGWLFSGHLSLKPLKSK